jgi:excisionase family DNA binding protein
MTVRQAAARLEVCQATVYALIAAGKLRCLRVGLKRGCIRITEDHISEYLRGAESRPCAPPPAPPARRFRHIRIKA